MILRNRCGKRHHRQHGCGDESAAKCFHFVPLKKPTQSSWNVSGFQTCISILSSYFAGVMRFPYDVIMAKEKHSLHDGCTILIFSTDDGCTRWWRWLQHTQRVIFDTHTADPLQTYMHIGCMIVVKCDSCKIFGAYAQVDCITTIVDNVGDRHSMQVTHSKKLKIRLWITWRHKL